MSPGAQSAAVVQVTTTPAHGLLAGSQIAEIPALVLVSQHSFCGTAHAAPLHVTDRVLLLLELADEEVDVECEAELDREIDPEHELDAEVELNPELALDPEIELVATLELDAQAPQSRMLPQPSLITPQKPTVHVFGTHRPASVGPEPSLPTPPSWPPPPVSPSWTRPPQLAVIPAMATNVTTPSSACFMAVTPLLSSRAPHWTRRNPG